MSPERGQSNTEARHQDSEALRGEDEEFPLFVRLVASVRKDTISVSMSRLCNYINKLAHIVSIVKTYIVLK